MSSLKFPINYKYYLFPRLSKSLLRNKAQVFKKQGLEIVDNVKDCTHVLLIRKPNNNDVKEVVGEGKPIISDQWIAQSVRSGNLQDMNMFLINDNNQDEKTDVESDDDSKLETEKNMDSLDTGDAVKKRERLEDDLQKNSDKGGKDFKSWESVLLNKPIHRVGTLENYSMENPNQAVIMVFSQLQTHYNNIGDRFRGMAYSRAINVLKNNPETFIQTAKQAREFPGFGSSLARDLEEIVKEQRSSRLEGLPESEKESSEELKLLTGIYSVGPVTAKKWIKMGVTTLEDASKLPFLTDIQKIGIKHYQDFNTKMTREEAQKHFNYVKTVLHDLDSKAEAHYMGSYRRGKSYCGDIDIILIYPDTVSRNDLMSRLKHLFNDLIRKLRATKFLAYVLKWPEEGISSKLLGCSQLPGASEWRRIDIMIAPPLEVGASFLYFTGSALFNQMMRMYAKKRGYKLSEHGLYQVKDNGKEEWVAGETEKSVFDVLQLPYREPWERDF